MLLSRESMKAQSSASVASSEEVLQPAKEMQQCLQESMNKEVSESLMDRFKSKASSQEQLLSQSDIADVCEAADAEDCDVCASYFGRTAKRVQEAIVSDHSLYLAVRPQTAVWNYLEVNMESLEVREVTSVAYLKAKEALKGVGNEPWRLEVDMAPFTSAFPRLTRVKSIGQGSRFLNKHLSARMALKSSGAPQMMLSFLRNIEHDGRSLILSKDVTTPAQMQRNLDQAEQLLEGMEDDVPAAEVADRLLELGLEAGWGKDVGRIRSTILLLQDLLQVPDDEPLQEFLSRLPLSLNVAIFSPHGFFGQKDVLGLPDTGGQVVYILDQVRALEREMLARIKEQGLDIAPRILIVTRLIPEARGTTCDQRIEAVDGCQHTSILRVPFMHKGEVVPHWISRFEVWPYLEQFALDSAQEIRKEMSDLPNLVVGNYCDGGLVASLLSHSLGLTHCNIAHALEKTKYVNSDMNWRELEDKHHFSCQFTSDLLAMNSADFIVTSSLQEIAGTATDVGQYESYTHFTMPGLYRVVKGVDTFDPKFNISAPGAEADVYFSYDKTDQRLTDLHEGFEKLLYSQDADDEDSVGCLSDKNKPVLFSMARLDSIKNITGLAKWFGGSKELREMVNLVVVAGVVDPEKSGDAGEKEECQKMHDLIKEHDLMDGSFRWLVAQTDRVVNGELYRYIADTRGAFVQPALYEAFGLTVVEAMTCGLPTFATNQGGPAEIIEHRKSGFHVDPHREDESVKTLVDFFKRCKEEEDYWQTMSDASLERIAAKYTWEIYADKMLTLSQIYAFWKHSTSLERRETRRYLEMFYTLQLRPLIAKVPLKGLKEEGGGD